MSTAKDMTVDRNTPFGSFQHFGLGGFLTIILPAFWAYHKWLVKTAQE